MSVEAFDPNAPLVHMSEEAAQKVRDFMNEESEDDLYLRVFVQGGGCSGFQYGFTFEDEPGEDDVVCELHGLKVLIDPLSYPYLEGATIAYQESLAGARFSINNPNASTTCGCGSSFSV
ncbi:iron-sulfur cluster insertion protein ErpA (plasmid) [Pseudomonas sp. FeN3W]|nr:iron-sulfur cluster insertion protein ErpA [Pseudomonas sp. FeN3W]